MKVPIVQLTLPDDVLEEVRSTLKSGMWVEGKPVRALEKEFAEYCGAKYCRAVNNGTAAVISTLCSLDLKPGDEVIVPSFTFIATANAVKSFGATPVFADIDPITFNLSPESVASKITEKTKGIMPVDLFGLCADYDEIYKIADEKDIKVVEDACQAHGAEYKGKKSGSLGLAGGFSLYPTKNMFCGGEGGLVVTNDESVYNKINRFVNHGQSKKYVHTEMGYNYRMPAVSGICARYSLSILDENNGKRIENAKLFNDLLSGIGDIITPTHDSSSKHVYHQYTIRTSKRDELSEEFIKNQIGFGIHYKIPIHKQEYYRSLGYNDSLPETEKASDEVISLPVQPLLSEEQIRFVADVIKKFYN